MTLLHQKIELKINLSSPMSEIWLWELVQILFYFKILFENWTCSFIDSVLRVFVLVPLVLLLTRGCCYWLLLIFFSLGDATFFMLLLLFSFYCYLLFFLLLLLFSFYCYYSFPIALLLFLLLLLFSHGVALFMRWSN